MTRTPATSPLNDDELAALQARLDELPPPLEPLDASMLDGYLCGVLLQPKGVPEAEWLRHVHDVDGREPPAEVALAPLHALVRRRHAELERAIAARQWFDPWVFELEDEDATPGDSVLPWVAGFVTALELFPALLRIDDPAMLEPLATVYMHLDPDDLEDADALLAEIETLEPPRDLAEAVEGLVRSTLLLADVTRPRPQAKAAGKPRRKAAAARRRQP